MKLIHAIMVILPLIIGGCAVDRTVVADYGGHKLYYREMKESLKIYKDNTFNIRANPEILRSNIMEMTITPKLIALESYESNKENPIFQKSMLTSEYTVLNNMLRQLRNNKFKLNTRLYKIRQIFFRFPFDMNDDQEKLIRGKAEAILDHLIKYPNDFFDYAMRLSDDQVTRPYGGESRYFTLSTTDPMLAGELLSMELKELKDTLIRTSGGYHIVQLLETVPVSEQSIRLYIRENQEIRQIIKAEQELYISNYVEELKNRYPVELKLENLESSDDHAVILQIGKHYTVNLAYLKFRMIQPRLTEQQVFSMNYKPEIPSDLKLNNIRYYIENSLIPEGIMVNEAYRLKLQKSLDYPILLSQFRNEFLQGLFRLSIQNEIIEPDSSTVQDYYEKNKEREFIDYRYQNQTGKTRSLPLKEVEPLIQSKLKMQRFDALMDEKKKRILEKYPVKIYINRIL